MDVLPVAVVVVVLLVVEAAVLEALVPFLVPVTNSICETHTHNFRALIQFLVLFDVSFNRSPGGRSLLKDGPPSTCVLLTTANFTTENNAAVPEDYMFIQVQSPSSGEATGTVLPLMITTCVMVFSNHVPVFLGDDSNLSVPALTRKLPLND